MNVLILYAHPNENSYNAALLREVKTGLGIGGHNCHVLDLYNEPGFNPSLIYNDQIKRRDLMHDPETENYRSLVTWAEKIILIYPVWWLGMPAILKGFFDRVFVSGFAFEYNKGFPKGLLRDKSAWVITTCDSPGWFMKIIRKDSEWTIMRKGILGFCGIRKVRRTLVSGMKTMSMTQRTKILKKIH